MFPAESDKALQEYYDHQHATDRAKRRQQEQRLEALRLAASLGSCMTAEALIDRAKAILRYMQEG